ncbi:MAG TPA: AmmeMemoRadiSam system protein B [Clostridia bacterium]|nr:AmmeMemoRadiSam system protein B [Clostridia bacterium]
MILRAYAVPHPPIILPEVGRGEEKNIKDTIAAFQRMAREIRQIAPDTIFISSPHAPMLADGFFIAGGDHAEGDLRSFGITNVREEVSLDQVFSSQLQVSLVKQNIPTSVMSSARHRLDHGTLIPLRFIHEQYKNFKLVVTGISLLADETHREVGRAVSRVADELGRRLVYVASGDLSHVLKEDGPYGFRPQGPPFDAEIARIFRTGDLESLFEFDPGLVEKAAECGLRSFQMMAGALDGLSVEPELYSYEGPFGVGYAVASFAPQETAD